MFALEFVKCEKKTQKTCSQIKPPLKMGSSTWPNSNNPAQSRFKLSLLADYVHKPVPIKHNCSTTTCLSIVNYTMLLHDLLGVETAGGVVTGGGVQQLENLLSQFDLEKHGQKGALGVP